MLEPMTVIAEVWPLAADDAGIWLISGGEQWQSDIIMADSDMHWEAEQQLWWHGVDRGSVVALHSTSTTSPGVRWTSWRPHGTSIVHTYMSVIRPAGLVLGAWPQALPLTIDLAEAVGRPAPHGAAEVPLPREIDVAFHGLSHIKWLIEHNAGIRAALIRTPWPRHLVPFEEQLATMFMPEAA